MHKRILLIGAALFLTALAGAAYMFFSNGPDAGSSLRSVAAEEPLPVRDVPPGFKEYASRAYRFSVLYQENLAASELMQNGGTLLVFEDTTDEENLKGFQVYAAQDTEHSLTQEFIKRYVPGAHTFESVTVDGAPGIAFISSDGALGEVREVWFAHKGNLYQAATPRPLETLLRSALETWEFI